MALYNANLAGSGSSVTIDDVVYEGDLKLKSLGNMSLFTSSLPFDLGEGSATVYKNKIHIMGRKYSNTGSDSERRAHYSWDGSTWKYETNLPYGFYEAPIVTYDEAIHLLSTYGETSNMSKHYKYNDSTWTSVSTLPFSACGSKAVVYKNKIHLFSPNYAGYANYHYSWNGSTWTQETDVPYSMGSEGAATVYNSEIHITAGNKVKYHYKYNGSTWTSVSTTPNDGSNAVLIERNNKLYLGCHTGNWYEWDETKAEWLEYFLSNETNAGCSRSSVVYNDMIHVLGGEGYYTAKPPYRHRLIEKVLKIK